MIIISLGGSLINPDKIDIDFLRNFRDMILKYTKKKSVAIICGGGRPAREYVEAAKKLVDSINEESDMIGIMATRLNAELVRIMFGKDAYEKVVINPTQKINTGKRIIIGAGWLPGCTTDTDAVLLAKNLKAKRIINLTNTDFVYDKDPRKFKDARPFSKLSWKQFRDIVGTKHSPGIHAPFDPVASKKAEELGLQVIILNGKNLSNLNNFLDGKEFIGTTIG
jgi:uridylate kinase